MDYIKIQDGAITVDIWLFIFIIGVPIVITILLQRYVPKILEILERKFINVVSWCLNKIKNGRIRIDLFIALHKIKKTSPECQKKNLDVILLNLPSDVGKEFAINHNLTKEIVHCCNSKKPAEVLTSLKILAFIINNGLNVQINRDDILTIIEIISIQNDDIQKKAWEMI